MISFVLALLLRAPDFVPIATKMSGIYIGAQIHTSDGKDHLFLVDTGSNDSYVSDKLVSDNEKKHHESVIRLDVGGFQVFATADPVGESRFSMMIGDQPTEGVLGLNLLKQIQLEIDYDTQSVRARYGSALGWAGPGHVPLLMAKDPDNLYTVGGQIGGKSIRLCVDTGASSMILDPKRVDLARLDKLAPARTRTFNGVMSTDRFLIETMKLSEHDFPWMIATIQPWKTSDDGTIGTAQLGGSRVTLDFPGSCIYVAKPDALSEAASRLLGIPVRVDGDSLLFRDNLQGNFKSASGARILAIRRVPAEAIVTALRTTGPDARKTLTEAFAAIRTLGLIATEKGGNRTLVPLQVMD